MGTRYNIAITATDAATAKVRAIKQGFAGLVRPITNIGSSVKALGKETGITKLVSGVGNLAKSAAGAMKNIGGIGGALAGAVGIGSISAVALYAKQWVNAQSATMRFSAVTGIAASKIQNLRGAAKLAGLSADDMDSSIHSLGDHLNDASQGNDNLAFQTMRGLGLEMHRTKTGAIDTVGTLRDLSKVLGPGGKWGNLSIQNKEKLTDILGVTPLLPMLVKGQDNLDKLQEKAAKLRPPISDADRAKADQYREKIDSLGLSFDNLGNAITLGVGPTVGGWLDYWTERINKTSAAMRKNGFAAQIGRNVLYNSGMSVTHVAETVGKGETWAVQKVLDNVKDIGRLISAGEGGYDSVNLGKRGGYKSGRTNLVESSIASVMKAQASGDFNAAGKYQMIRGTLASGVKALHIDPSQKFDEGMQDRIFNEYLLKMKRPQIGDYISGKSSDLHGAVKAASEEWASIADPDTGKSHYAGVANNKSSVSAEAFADALKSARLAQAIRPPSTPLAQAIRPPSTPLAQAVRPPSTPLAQAVRPPSTPLEVAAAGAGSGATSLPDVWTGTKPSLRSPEQTFHFKITTPAGTKAEVTGGSAPVRTTLKTESSMPDYQ